MISGPAIDHPPVQIRSSQFLPKHERGRRLGTAELNTLDQALQCAHAYAEEIKQDTNSRRIYKSFAALANSPFEALLAFSLWKVKSLSSSKV